MQSTGEFVRGLILLILMIGGVLAFAVWTTIRAEEPGRRLVKWLLSAPIVAFMIWRVAPIVAQGGYTGAFGGIPLAALCGLGLALIWCSDIAGYFARPLGSLFDGGDTPPDPAPAYSIAQAKQKKGEYVEAVAEIRKQLDRFPTDVEGHMLLAQIQAEDLKDLAGAELTIERFCNQQGHAPRNVSFALYSLADWQLQYGKDIEAARRALQKIIELYPDSEFSNVASQRIAHLSNTAAILSHDDPRRIPVPHAPPGLGLTARRMEPAAEAPQADPAEEAGDLVQHLEEHPLDGDAREKLAALYVDHYQRVDLAVDQLEQLIALPNQPFKQIARWLNLMADFQIRAGVDYETVRDTLQRIIDSDPKSAPAEKARNRLGLLRLEMKSKEPTRAVKMGNYEQRLGLKGKGPNPRDNR